jgi:putative restriction endonuclease
VVRELLPEQQPHLSADLWSDAKYRYIFFFDTEELNLTWPELREHLGFRPNYNPGGQFMPVAPERLAPLGGAERYVESLRFRYGISHSPLDESPDTTLTETVGGRSTEHVQQTNRQLERLRKISTSGEPVLTEGRPRVEYRRSAVPRDDAFRRGVTDLYGFKCAVCGLGLRGPNGSVEVQGAHIYPKALDGKDDLRNGICLCRLHHWAFDTGWFWLTDDCKIIVRDDIPQTDDYSFIRSFANTQITLPAEHDLKPDPLFLRARRALYSIE